jgi:hypothetical protein
MLHIIFLFYAYFTIVGTVSNTVTYAIVDAFFDCYKTVKINKVACRGADEIPLRCLSQLL